MEKNKKKWYKSWWMIIIYVIVGFNFLSLLFVGEPTGEDKKRWEEERKLEAEKLKTEKIEKEKRIQELSVIYENLYFEEEDVSYLNCKRLNLRVLLNNSLDENERNAFFDLYNKKYKEKFNEINIFFINGEKEDIGKKVAFDKKTFGKCIEKVKNSDWDGSVSQIESFLEKNLNDPDSYESIEWSEVIKNDKGYVVRHKYRAKNGFGALIIQNQIFYLDFDGNILDVKEYN